MVNCGLVLFPLMPGVVSGSARDIVDKEYIIQETISGPEFSLASAINGRARLRLLIGCRTIPNAMPRGLRGLWSLAGQFQEKPRYKNGTDWSDSLT